MHYLRLLSFSLTILFAATAARAAEPAAPEDPIELASLEVTTHPTGADERTAAVRVMRPDTTKAPMTIGDLLNQVPGVHLDRAGGAGGRSTLHLRGGEENHTLVLLDGVPLNDPTNSRGSGVDFSLIDPAALDSAALVRGPAPTRTAGPTTSGCVRARTGAAHSASCGGR